MKFIHKHNSGVEESEMNQLKNELASYVKECGVVAAERNYERDEASLCLVDDSTNIAEVEKVVKEKKSDNLKYVIDIGIGGSNLGTKAIYDAVYGATDLLQPERRPRIIFLDTTDPEYLFHFVHFFKSQSFKEGEVVVNIISKSGGTTETAVNGEVVIDLLKGVSDSWKKMCVVTTDKGSKLHENAQALGIDVLEIPKKVGGRYSVFSAVGLFPLALCGMDIKSILNSARLMRDRCLTLGEDNIALISSAILYHHLKRGIAINDNFYFHTELESMGKWYRQLMGESTGKNGMGLTPTVSMGSVDLHSVVQLYLGGPKNKYTSFVYTDIFKEINIPSTNILTHIKEIEGRQVGAIMGAIQQGTIAAYKNLNLPYSETILEGVSAEEVAAYMQFKMVEMMFLGKLMKVNTFDQPQVELYKIETKKILAKK